MIGNFTGRTNRIIQFLHTNLRLCHWRLKIILARGSLPSKNKQTMPTLITNLFNKYSNKQERLFLILIYLQSLYFLLQYRAKLRLEIGANFLFWCALSLLATTIQITLCMIDRNLLFFHSLCRKNCTSYKVLTM